MKKVMTKLLHRFVWNQHNNPIVSRRGQPLLLSLSLSLLLFVLCVVVDDGGSNTDGVALVVVATNGRVDCVVMSVDVRISGYVLL